MSSWWYIFITRSATRINFKPPIPIRLSVPIAQIFAGTGPPARVRPKYRYLGEFPSVETVDFRNIGLCALRAQLFSELKTYARTTTPTRSVKIGHPDRRRFLMVSTSERESGRTKMQETDNPLNPRWSFSRHEKPRAVKCRALKKMSGTWKRTNFNFLRHIELK